MLGSDVCALNEKSLPLKHLWELSNKTFSSYKASVISSKHSGTYTVASKPYSTNNIYDPFLGPKIHVKYVPEWFTAMCICQEVGFLFLWQWKTPKNVSVLIFCQNQERNMGIHLEANVLGIHLSGKITIYTVLPRASTSSQHWLQVVLGFCIQNESNFEAQHHVTLLIDTPPSMKNIKVGLSFTIKLVSNN